MLTPLFWLALVVAAADWVFATLCWKKFRLVTKPGALLLLIAWFAQVGGWDGPLLWFGLALVLSLAGDVLLLLPERFFIGGLAAFLVAHIFYVVGLNAAPLPAAGRILIVVLTVGLVGSLVFRSVRRGLLRRPEGRSMLVPVAVYSLVISLMLASALLNFWRPGYPIQAALPTAIGAGLFFISDTLLATNRFDRPIPLCDTQVMLTYHLGQIGLAMGALIAFRS